MDSEAHKPVPTRPARLSRARRTAMLKALADPKRFELLERLAAASCPLTCSAVQPALAISPATLSHHLKELESAGLIAVRREGKFHFMSVRPGALDALIVSLAALRAEGCGATLGASHLSGQKTKTSAKVGHPAPEISK